MTIRCKLTVAALVTSTVAAAALFLSPAPQAQAQGQGRSVTVSGTIYGSLDFAYPGGPAWVGHALISFDKQAPLTATFVDKGWHEFKPNGGMIGGETITLTFDGGTLEILGRFESNLGSTPGLVYLHETGSLANGTGAFAGVSGHVTVQGPAVVPPAGAGAPTWISEIHGVVLGAE
ncbi:MAG TPA: hypothetical protein VJA21_00270 [Verrucomicrobiae bacterium]